MTLPMLPDSWSEIAGGDFTSNEKQDIVDGPFGSNLKASEYTNSGVPIARIQNVKRFRFLDKNIRYVTEDKASELDRHTFVSGDILITKLGDPLGLACLAPPSIKKGVIVADLVRFRPDPSMVDTTFLIYLLNSDTVIKQIAEHVKGTTRPRINLTVIRSLRLPLIPLAEQREIARRLDELLAQVDTIKTRLDGLPKILKRFRQSTLAAAVSGKLTEQWRENDSYSAVDLGLSKRSLVIDFPNDWKIEKLADSCGVISGNAFKSKDFIESGVPVIKISNVQYGEFEVKNQQYLPESFLDNNSRFIVQPSDVLMALTRPITNDTLKICRYPNNAELGLLNQRVCKFDFTNDDGKRFFELLFQSDYFKAQVEGNLSETLQPNLSPTDLKKFIVGIPDTEEQTEIVRRVEELFTFADQVEQRVKDAQAHVNHLTQSILAKAFRGELTESWRAEHPKLISGENSAAALLKRIKTERENQTPKKKTRKKSLGS